MKTRLRAQWCAILIAAAGLFACQSEEVTPTEDPQPEQVTYPMTFNGQLIEFDGTKTRSSTEWPNNATIFLCLHNGNNYITGTAKYRLSDDSWSFLPNDIDAPLKSDAEGICEAYYFAPTRQNGNIITVGTDVITYEQLDGNYSIDEYAPEEGLPRLIVSAILSPKTGRIRFVGTPSKTYTISGLRAVKTFTTRSSAVPTYAFSTDAISVTCGADGSTPYTHVLFPEDSRTLRITNTSKSYFERSFAANVLRPAASGYLTIPTAANPGSWTLKNNNGQAIAEVNVSDITIESKSYRSARISATVNAGNGEITESGFIYSVRSIGDNDFSRSDVKRIDLGGSSLNASLTGLTETTTYYVRAFATNELGRRIGKQITFTTEAKPEGTTFDRTEYGSESGWD